MKEQTAVELVKQLFFTYAESAWYNDEDSWTISNTDFEQIINQALKVERDRIIDDYISGYSASENRGDSEKYYDEAYYISGYGYSATENRGDPEKYYGLGVKDLENDGL
jgi:hypothetical protein